MKKKKLGDCFQWTGRFALYNSKSDPSEILTPTNEKFYGVPKVIHAVFKDSQGLIVSHAYLQDEKFVYEKLSNRKKYKVIDITTYYKEGLLFKINGEPVKMKLDSFAEHTFENLVDLMVKDGGNFGRYGIESDL